MKSIAVFIKSDLFILALGKLIQTVLLFFAVKLYTKYLSDEEVGNLILILSMTMFIGLALVNPIGSFITREVNAWINNKIFYRNFLIFNLYVLIVSIFSFFVPYILNYFGIGKSIPTLYFSIAVSLFVFFNTLNQTIIPALNLLFYRKAFVVFTVVSISMYLTLSVSFVVIFEATAFWWLIGQILGLGVGFIGALFYFLKHVVAWQMSDMFNITTAGLQKILKFSVPLSIATFMLWVLTSAYKLIIEGQLGAATLAYIGLALALATALSGAVETLLMQVFHSSFYKDISDAKTAEERSKVFQIFINRTVPLTTGAIFVLICLSPFLLKLLADDRFSIIYPYLMLGLILEFLRVMTNIISHAAHSEYKTQKNILPYTAGAVIALFCISYSIKQEQWEYYTLASLFSGWLLSLIIMIRQAKFLLKFELPVVQVFKIILHLSPVAPLTWYFSDTSKFTLPSLGIIAVVGSFASVILYKQHQRVT